MSEQFRGFCHTPPSEILIGPDGTIVLWCSHQPTLATYEFLEAYIALRKAHMPRTADPAPVEGATP